MTDIKDFLTKVITERAMKLIQKLKKFDLKGHYYIGGNSSNNNVIKDIDIFPKAITRLEDIKEISSTKNAKTYIQDNTILQVCHYHKATLEELINSFDYAHIQVGVEIKDNTIVKVYFTDEYIKAHSIDNSYYLKSEYPLSSLIRASKYFNKGEMSKGRTIYSILKALIDVIERGFYN